MNIYLAGTYGLHKHKESIKKALYVLESFFYIKPWQYELIHSAKGFMLDSGAFTFMQQTKKDLDVNSINFDEYVEQYAQFVVEHDVKLFFELDIDSVVGYSRVKDMRARLETLTGRQCIPVWHSNRGLDDFLKTCDEYPYVALGGIVGNEWRNDKEKFIPWFIREAHRRGTKIHGLGFTKLSKLTQYHFDSVDSTRWNCGRFGRVEYFDGKTIRPIDRRKDGQRMVSYDDMRPLTFSFLQWTLFQRYAEVHM